MARVESERQIAANRDNALKSTGPRTEAGKAIAAQNARTHGLLARAVVAKGESQKDFRAFHSRLVACLAPEGELEELVADRIAACAWRLRRVGLIESEYLSAEVSYSWDSIWDDEETDDSEDGSDDSQQAAGPDPSQLPEHLQVGYSEKSGGRKTIVVEYKQQEAMICTRSTHTPGERFWHRSERLELLSRYERATENSLFRALHELERLQAARRGAAVAVPAVIDVTVAGDKQGRG